MPHPEIFGTRMKYKPRFFFKNKYECTLHTTYEDHKDCNGRLTKHPDTNGSPNATIDQND